MAARVSQHQAQNDDTNPALAPARLSPESFRCSTGNRKRRGNKSLGWANHAQIRHQGQYSGGNGVPRSARIDHDGRATRVLEKVLGVRVLMTTEYAEGKHQQQPGRPLFQIPLFHFQFPWADSSSATGGDSPLWW